MSKLDCKKPKPCEPTPPPKPTPCSPAFDLCVGDHTLKWDGFCPTVERSRHTPDGTYTSVTVVNGCIVAYGYADEPTYTPPYCTPNPAPCQETNGGATATVSPHTDNSLVVSASGLFARTFIQGGDGVSVTGKGTQTAPYVITFNAGGGNTDVVGEAGIMHRESNGITYLGLSPTGIASGMYNGFSINEYGQIVGFSSSVSQDDTAVKAGAGLVATSDGDYTTIAHEEHDLDETVVFGGFAVSINKSGHITDMERIATVTAGTYTIGAYNVAINEFGGITNVVQNDEVPDGAGNFTTTDNKVVSYDETGRITSVEDYNALVNPNTQATPQSAPLPIRDMYRIRVIPRELYVVIETETFGSAVTVTHDRDKSVSFILPAYITSASQVQVHGAESYAIENNKVIAKHGIEGGHNNEKIITITLRA